MHSAYIKNELREKSSHIKIAGVIQKKDARMSQRGRFVTIQLSDQYGNIDVTIFSEEILKKYVHLLDVKTIVVVSCDAFKDEGGFRLTAVKIEGIDELLHSTQYNLTLNVRNEKELAKILALLQSDSNDTKPNVGIEILYKLDEYFVSKIKLPPLFLDTEVIKKLQQL